jgi:hypothetical protein
MGNGLHRGGVLALVGAWADHPRAVRAIGEEAGALGWHVVTHDLPRVDQLPPRTAALVLGAPSIHAVDVGADIRIVPMRARSGVSGAQFEVYSRLGPASLAHTSSTASVPYIVVPADHRMGAWVASYLRDLEVELATPDNVVRATIGAAVDTISRLLDEVASLRGSRSTLITRIVELEDELSQLKLVRDALVIELNKSKGPSSRLTRFWSGAATVVLSVIGGAAGGLAQGVVETQFETPTRVEIFADRSDDEAELLTALASAFDACSRLEKEAVPGQTATTDAIPPIAPPPSSESPPD